jgi:putative ABC transport system permease protein
MSFFDHLMQAWQNLRSNKMRAFLSILWLVIGVVSVTVMVSVGEWLQDQVLWEFEDATTNSITVIAWQSFNPFATQRSAELPWFTDSDVAFFGSSMDFVKNVTPISELTEKMTIRGEETDVRVVAWSKAYMEMEWMKLVAWRMLNEQDLSRYTNVVVVSDNTVEDYLEIDAEQSVWAEVLVWDQYFTIVWVTEAQGWWFVDVKTAVIPITTAQQKITNNPFYPYVSLEIDEDLPASEAVKLVKYTMLKRQWASHMDDALFQVMSTETMMEQITNISSMLQLALWWIGAISLLVGWIGVMNIMLVSVTERTREIGIRKAIWAKYKDILLQFLTESIFLGLLGCVIWVFLSWWIIVWLQFAWVPALLNLKTILVAVIFSWGTGIIFGVWPARKAAKMKPIDALRFE